MLPIFLRMIKRKVLQNCIFKTLVIVLWFNPLIISAQEYNELLLDGAWANDVDVVRNAIQNKADVNTASFDGATALHFACMNENLVMVNILVSAGAKVNSADDDLKTPLHVAARNGNDTIAEFLILHGANMKLRDSDGRTPIMISVQNGYYVFADLCFFYGADASGKDNDSIGLCHLAVASAYPDMLELVIAKGAAVNTCDIRGYTPLMVAAARNDTAMLHLLLRNGAQVDYACNKAFSPDLLSVVSMRGNAEVMSFLLDLPEIRKQNLRKAHDDVFRTDNNDIRKLFRQKDIPMTMKPIFFGVTVQPELLINFRDHFAGFSVETMEMKTKIGFSMGLATRLWNKNVLYEYAAFGETLQLKERRSVLYFREYKAIRLLQNQRSGLRLELGVQETFSWGKFSGVSFDTWQGWMVSPAADVTWFDPSFSLSFGCRMLDFHNNLPAVYFSLHGGITIPYL